MSIGHDHGIKNHHHHHHDLDGKALIWSIIINISITSAQVIGGVLSGSLALLSDAMHNLSDVLALIFSYVANRLATKESTLRYTFGLKRAEILASFINSLILVLVGLGLFYEAAMRLLEPETIDSFTVIVLALVGILGNGLSALLLSSGAKHNMNMKSAYLHLLVDMLTSIAVLLGGMGMYYFNAPYIDSILTILIAIYLCYSGWFLLIDSVKILMQFTPRHLDLVKLLAELREIPSIKNIHHVHAWQLSDSDIYVEAHVETLENLKLSECSDIRTQILKVCRKKTYNINNLITQFEFNEGCSSDTLTGHED